ncbi:Geranylgeranyl pyrophosphate synthase [Eumeta japonica]|uniref:Geranylgeranyl pyrophosphate synthase n=1 Tax=Eumeta variegata TaxID=151549 RepID=A0A4C2ADB1_EUMVA|nr:Geranylgeranyl pyrophosphate synthase [Eumeta japonica]
MDSVFAILATCFILLFFKSGSVGVNAIEGRIAESDLGSKPKLRTERGLKSNVGWGLRARYLKDERVRSVCSTSHTRATSQAQSWDALSCYAARVRAMRTLAEGGVALGRENPNWTDVEWFDDIQDNSILRRGVPVAHSIYGVASTINAANYVMIAALERTMDLGHSEATKVYTEQLLELHRGQGMEIYWRDNFHCPTKEEYEAMCIKKTGGLFMLAIRLMQLFSTNEANLTKLTSTLGLYFQIRDDYCNLCLQEYAQNKGYCEDLTEGKFSFPTIHAITTHERGQQRTRDVEVKRYCVSLLERLGSFDYTRRTLRQLDKEARNEVARLGGNPQLEALLDELLSWQDDVRSTQPGTNGV